MTVPLAWLSFVSWLKKALSLCKKYWQILLGIAIPIVLMLIFRKKADMTKVLDRARDDHQKEVDAINRAHEEEIAARDRAQKRYVETIGELEQRYGDEKSDLDTSKKKMVKKILKESAENPEEITRRIAELTGFEIHVE